MDIGGNVILPLVFVDAFDSDLWDGFCDHLRSYCNIVFPSSGIPGTESICPMQTWSLKYIHVLNLESQWPYP